MTNLVCGDAYIIEGQSNAVATDNAATPDTTTDPWIRTYGRSGGGWGYAVSRGSEWNRFLGLGSGPLSVTAPITCPSASSTARWAAPASTSTRQSGGSYGGGQLPIRSTPTCYNRVAGANLTHGIRGVFWHQGENNSGAAAPTGDWDYKSYQQYFVDMSAAWKQDYPEYPALYHLSGDAETLRDGPQRRPTARGATHLAAACSRTWTSWTRWGWPATRAAISAPQVIRTSANLTAPLVSQDFYGMVPPASRHRAEPPARLLHHRRQE